MCENITMLIYAAWIKVYYVLCSKADNTSGNLLQSPASLQQAARIAHNCETCLLTHFPGYLLLISQQGLDFIEFCIGI